MPMTNLPIFCPLADSGDVTDLSEKAINFPEDTPVWFFRVNIDVDLRGDISFHYDNASSGKISSQADLDKLIAKVANFTEPRWGDVLSTTVGDTPFSINCTSKCVFVLVLHPSRNWQFSHDKAPFQIKSGREPFYFNATRVDRSGKPLVGAGTSHGCKVAYFYGECDRDRAAQGGGDFKTAFNIHLDLLLYWQGKELTLPIVVDPDVGHPGGGTPP